MDREILKRLDRISEKIIALEMTLYQHLEIQKNSQIILDQKVYTITAKVEQIDLLNASINTVVSNMACVQENMEEVVRRLERTETSVNTTLKHGQDEGKKALVDFRTQATTDMKLLNEDVKNSLNNLETTMVAEVSAVKEVVVETRSLVKTYYDNDILKDNFESVTREIKTQCYESTNNIRDYIDRTKYDIFTMTEKEAKIVRDRIEGPLPSPGKYTFDFFVLDFKSLVRSGKDVFSLPWYIDEIKSCVMGQVWLKPSRKMSVYVIHGRHPLSAGLQPLTNSKQLKVKAIICDINRKILPDLEVGELTWTPDETRICTHMHQGDGLLLGTKSCDDLLQKGYGVKEAYKYGAVLIRYYVTVL